MKKILVLALAVVMALVCVGALADITLDEAKQIALDRAGVAAEDALFIKAHTDRDDGRAVYDIEFYSNATEYEFDVDVVTGEITEFETEQHAAFFSTGKITLEEAKQLALAKVGVKEEEATFRKAHQDEDDGRLVYEIEIVANGLEYDFDIDAATGRITESDVERDDHD